MSDENLIPEIVPPRVVTEDDNGIRPAGPPDACFYCRRKIGERHEEDCATVTAKGTYIVKLNGEEIGSWICEEPRSWDKDQRYFHKNLGTLCRNNIRHFGMLNLTKGDLPPEEVDDCLCAAVELIPLTPEEALLHFGGVG